MPGQERRLVDHLSNEQDPSAINQETVRKLPNLRVQAGIYCLGDFSATQGPSISDHLSLAGHCPVLPTLHSIHFKQFNPPNRINFYRTQKWQIGI
jgi:hypothetical protein